MTDKKNEVSVSNLAHTVKLTPKSQRMEQS